MEIVNIKTKYDMFKTLKDRINYFDTLIYEDLKNGDEKQIYGFLKENILNKNENLYLRKKSIDILTELIFQGKMKQRYILNIFLDEWEHTEEIILEVARLKKISLFYELDKDEIVNNLNEATKSHILEIASEGNYQLGVINLLDANKMTTKSEYEEELLKSKDFFASCQENDENRIDALMFEIICNILYSLMNFNQELADFKLKQLRELVWKQQMLQLDDNWTMVSVSIYRVLYNLCMINKVNPVEWLDYKTEFNQLCYYFYKFKEEGIRNEVHFNNLNTSIVSSMEKYSLDTFFKVTFESQMCKIDKMIASVDKDKDSQQYKLLEYIKELLKEYKAEDEEKIKVYYEQLKCVDNTAEYEEVKGVIERALYEKDFLPVCQWLKKVDQYSYENLLDQIISASIKLQGCKMYSNASEDDRNSFIASLLEAGGYANKDQTRWGSSNEGINAGEIDIQITKKNGVPYAVIEALNLDSLKKAYLNLHLDKIFKYDTTGLKCNFILVYAEVRNFQTFISKYIKHIGEHIYPYALQSIEEIGCYEYTNLKVMKTVHNRNGMEISLYHICVAII